MADPKPPGSSPSKPETVTVDGTINPADAASAQAAADATARMAADLNLATEKQREKLELQQRALRTQQDMLGVGKAQLEQATLFVRQLEEMTAKGANTKKLEAQFAALAARMDLGTKALNKFKSIMADKNLTGPQRQAELEKFRGKLEDVGDFANDVAGGLGKFAGALGVTSKLSESATGKLFGMAATLGEGFTEDKLTKIREGLSGMFSPMNILASVGDQIKDFAFQLDAAGAAFGKATGFGRGFEKQILEVYKGTVLSGVSMQEAGQAMQTLATSFSGFDPTAKSVNKTMVTNVALLEKIGVSGAESAKMMDNLARSFNMGGIEAANLTREIITAGQAAGITATKMASDFQAAFGKLAQYGAEATSVFKGMAAQAKATGIEMGTLIGMAEKFDTFEGAATSAASLNAVLGTQLSSVDLLNANYEQRINLLREGIQTTVGNFDSMDRFTQMYVAQAIGAKDVAEAQKLINMSTSEYMGYKDDMAANAKTQEELAKTTKDLVQITDKLKLAFYDLVLSLSPVIEGLTFVMQSLADSWGLLLLVGVPTIAFLAAYKVASIAAAAATAINTMAALRWIPIAYGSATATTVLAGAMKLLFGPVGLAIGLFSTFFAILTMKKSPEAWALAGFMAIGVVTLAVALYLIQGPAQVALFLIAAMAFSFALMFYAMSEGAGTMATMIAELTDVEKLLESSMAIYSIAGAVGALGLAAIMSIGAVGILFAALTGIGALIAGVGMITGVNALGAVGDNVAKIGDGLTKFASGMLTIKSAVAEIKALGGGGFIAATVEGNKTSMVVAGKDVINTVKAGEINVKVDMPEVNVPKTVVHVYIDGKELEKRSVRVTSDILAGE